MQRVSEEEGSVLRPDIRKRIIVILLWVSFVSQNDSAAAAASRILLRSVSRCIRRVRARRRPTPSQYELMVNA